MKTPEDYSTLDALIAEKFELCEFVGDCDFCKREDKDFKSWTRLNDGEAEAYWCSVCAVKVLIAESAQEESYRLYPIEEELKIAKRQLAQRHSADGVEDNSPEIIAKGITDQLLSRYDEGYDSKTSLSRLIENAIFRERKEIDNLNQQLAKQVFDSCDKYEELEEKAKSFEGSFNSATKSLAKQMEIIDRLTQETFGYKKEINALKLDVDFLKESRSKWAKQSSENADALDAVLKLKGNFEEVADKIVSDWHDQFKFNYGLTSLKIAIASALSTLSHEGLGRENVAVEALEQIIKNDKTVYDYGKSKDAQNRNGQLPEGSGKRWQTPREIAEGALKQLRGK